MIDFFNSILNVLAYIYLSPNGKLFYSLIAGGIFFSWMRERSYKEGATFMQKYFRSGYLKPIGYFYSALALICFAASPLVLFVGIGMAE